MEMHTLRAVKLTQNIFKIHRINKELDVVRGVLKDLEQQKIELLTSA